MRTECQRDGARAQREGRKGGDDRIDKKERGITWLKTVAEEEKDIQ